MRGCLVVFGCAALLGLAGCEIGDGDVAVPGDDLEVEEPPPELADPGAELEDPAADLSLEDLALGDEEFEMPDTAEAGGRHRLHATDANLRFLRRGCFRGHALVWTCPRDDDGRHINLRRRHRAGVDRTTVADNHGYYWGECVSLVKAAAKSDAVTSTWRRGVGVFSGLRSGTALATFPGGRFSGHAVILLSYVRRGGHTIGIRVADQNWGGRFVHRHIIYRSGSGVGNADAYHAIVAP